MFVVIGIVGALLLILFLVFDDVLDQLLPDADWISGPALGAFLAAFGIVGWMVTDAFDAPSWVAVLAGTVGGVALGWFTLRLTRAVAGMATDGTPSAQSIVGREGRVVTAIVPGGVGEVLVTVAGQSVKLTAASPDRLERGAAVVVIAVDSPTKVVVQSSESFWGEGSTPS